MVMLKKSISISPLFAVLIGFLTLGATVTITYGTMNRSEGAESKQIEVNTKILERMNDVVIPEMYGALGRNKTEIEGLKLDVAVKAEKLQNIERGIEEIKSILKEMNRNQRKGATK